MTVITMNMSAEDLAEVRETSCALVSERVFTTVFTTFSGFIAETMPPVWREGIPSFT